MVCCTAQSCASCVVQRLAKSSTCCHEFLTVPHRPVMLQVQGIMVVLTRHGLVMKHMDMLWNIAQKEDAHEAVKAHMYDLLAEVAADFEAEELGALLERLRARLSTPLLPADTLRLLGLLERLAQADTAVRVPFRTAPSCTLQQPTLDLPLLLPPQRDVQRCTAFSFCKFRHSPAHFAVQVVAHHPQPSRPICLCSATRASPSLTLCGILPLHRMRQPNCLKLLPCPKWLESTCSTHRCAPAAAVGAAAVIMPPAPALSCTCCPVSLPVCW
jgi:hypothetical protein